MEKKSLGRGLEHISDIFLSTEKKIRLPSEKTRPDDPGNDTRPESADPPAPGEAIAPLSDMDENDAFLATDMCEVEEKVMIEKNIAYPQAPESQKKIIKLLCRHLEADYSIKRIELIKNNKDYRPGKNKLTEEKICIYLEDHPPIMEF